MDLSQHLLRGRVIQNLNVSPKHKLKLVSLSNYHVEYKATDITVTLTLRGASVVDSLVYVLASLYQE